ncbi:heterokaryon incompatibility protein-domain-containing protein [Paraphoma chrysanthemicola]|uniref:Heterokaryon incompatibility protein-domain-containing protein n=1 Tax=Paraphoma chrysanthemicola TaxID=798071 RepID=A0A8K0RDN7_9PLEO|nr:heterokaryon incompatibility protein-domain-containing protein [Paraphoma chrysanthemicola]
MPRWTRSHPYKKLQPDQIRLIRVSPSSDDAEYSLTCAFETYALSEKPVFSALSYTWGQPLQDIEIVRKSPAKPTRKIFCNGEEGQAGQNLYDFLVHYASNVPQGGLLWIDALSINQGDTQERSEQVKLMSQIYQNAQGVLVWLGPEDQMTDSALKLLQGVLLLTPDERSMFHPNDATTNHENPLLDLRNWQALALFFQREWFRRTCIWTGLLENLAGHDRTQAGGTRTLGHNTPARLAAAKRTWRSEEDNKFLYALIRARPSDSENPRDKVYSQLGLGDADISPDYKASVADVYITTAKYILEHSDSLFLLTCVEGEQFQKVPGLPSWVPDWSMSKTLGLRVTGYPEFHAALNLPKEQSIYTDPNGTHVLRIKATKLDDIIDVCEPKGQLHNIVWRALMTNREGSGTTPSGAFVGPKYRPSPEFLGPAFRAWILWRYVCAADEPVTFPRPAPGSTLLPSEAEIQAARVQALADPAYVAELKHRGSRFDLHYSHAMLLRPFCTRNGAFGIGTQCLDCGDEVWIAPGCPVPLILRRVQGGERYRLVGGSYLHGFMNGEVLEREGLEFTMVDLE